MNNSSKTVLRKFFHIICIIAALILIIYCIIRYVADGDVTHIDYSKFHEESDRVYPSITICFTKPFVAEKLSQYDQDISVGSYKDFLSGYDDKTWNISLAEIDYDEVTIQLKDYLRYVWINLLNNDNL